MKSERKAMNNFERLSKMTEKELRSFLYHFCDTCDADCPENCPECLYNYMAKEAEPTAIEMMESLGWGADNDGKDSIQFNKYGGGHIFANECKLTFGQEFYSPFKYVYTIEEIHAIEKAYEKLKKERGWE